MLSKMLQSSRRTGTGRLAIYGTNILVSFHYFLVIYINSIVLSTYVGPQELSLLYIIGSALSVALFFFFAPLIRRSGNYHLSLVFVALEILALLGLAAGRSVVPVILSFLLYLAVSPIIYLNLDIFLERSIKNEGTTGGVRGMFLTMQNIAQVICPLLVGLLLFHNDYWRVYVASLAFLFAALIVLVAYLRHFNDARYHPRTLLQSAEYVLTHPLLYDAVAAQFLLRFFYAWMVIYTPLYLFKNIGFSWAQIGTMFAIMLLPFLLLELPLGKLVDSKLEERTILVIGFALMALAVFLMPFLTAPAFVVWTAVLCLSRIGASCTEIATESYFFKHVDGALADTISLFRVARPAAYIAAAGVAALTLLFVSFKWSFVVLALVMLWGIRYGLRMKRTK